jgi:hypothetical protein
VYNASDDDVRQPGAGQTSQSLTLQINKYLGMDYDYSEDSLAFWLRNNSALVVFSCDHIVPDFLTRTCRHLLTLDAITTSNNLKFTVFEYYNNNCLCQSTILLAEVASNWILNFIMFYCLLH